MKKNIILVIALLASFHSFSQTDSTKIEQYCEVIATPVYSAIRVTLEVKLRRREKYWRDTRLKNDDGG
jgi:hypothetical protein